METLVWCFGMKNGLRLTEPSEEEWEGYEAASKESLIESKNVGEQWKLVILYYAAYQKVYGILRLIGLKSDNHACTISAIEFILKYLGENTIPAQKLSNLFEKRKEVQYKLKRIKVSESEVVELIDSFEVVRKKVRLNISRLRKEFEKILKIVRGEKEV